jgi:integrase
VFLKAVMDSNVRRQFKVALRLILLTLVRKSELMLARWEHVDVEKAEWHIPAENSQTGKPHIVCLSPQALALFAELRSLAGGSELVLPGRGSLTKPFAHNALKVALRGQDIPAFTIHDLRRTASTLLREHRWPADVVEKALNHTIGGVRGVYNRAEYAGQRREMLGFWGEVCGGVGEGGLIGGVRPEAVVPEEARASRRLPTLTPLAGRKSRGIEAQGTFSVARDILHFDPTKCANRLSAS